MAKHRLEEWLKEDFIAEPNKPTNDINEILNLDYKHFADAELHVVEQYMFVMTSWLFYISYQLGLHESRTRAKREIYEKDAVFISQKYKSNYYEERISLAKTNDEDLRIRGVQLLADEAKVMMLKEIKFSLRDKIGMVKNIYFRKRGSYYEDRSS